MTEPAPLLDRHRLKVATRDWSIACGRTMRERRKALGFDQARLATLVGVEPQSISRFEQGENTPRDAVRLAIAYALMCEVNDIWPPMDRRYISMVAA